MKLLSQSGRKGHKALKLRSALEGALLLKQPVSVKK